MKHQNQVGGKSPSAEVVHAWTLQRLAAGHPIVVEQNGLRHGTVRDHGLRHEIGRTETRIKKLGARPEEVRAEAPKFAIREMRTLNIASGYDRVAGSLLR